MTLDETKALIEMLRASGITHYKTADIELNLGPAPVLPVVSRETIASNEAETVPGPIPHIVKELTSLLKLSDTDLVDRLFPDTNGDGEETANDEAN